MKSKEKGSHAMPPSSAEASGPGMVRRGLGGWRRIEEAILHMNYGPYDHVADRLRALETRVAELESRPNPLKNP